VEAIGRDVQDAHHGGPVGVERVPGRRARQRPAELRRDVCEAEPVGLDGVRERPEFRNRPGDDGRDELAGGAGGRPPTLAADRLDPLRHPRRLGLPEVHREHPVVEVRRRGVGEPRPGERALVDSARPVLGDDHARPAVPCLRDGVQRPGDEDEVRPVGRGERPFRGLRDRLDPFDRRGVALEGSCEHGGVLGPVVGRPGDVRGVDWRQRVHHALVVLVRHRTEDHVEGVVLVSSDEGPQCGGGAGVVRAIEDDPRVSRDELEPARPGRALEPVGDGVRVDVGDLSRQRRGDAGVDRLVLSKQRERRLDSPVRASDGHVALDVPSHPVLDRQDVRVGRPDGYRVRLFPDGLQGRPGRTGDQRPTRRRDLALVPGDLLDSVPEQVGVFEADAGDRAGDGVDRARRVVAAADPHFEDGDVHVLDAEVIEREGGDDLEVGRGVVVGLEAANTGLDRLDVLRELCPGDFPAVDPDLLAQVVEPWRREQPDVQARRPEHGLEHAGGTPFPVRPRDLDAVEPVLRVPQRREHPCRRLHAEFGPLALERPQVLGRLVVLHATFPRWRRN